MNRCFVAPAAFQAVLSRSAFWIALFAASAGFGLACLPAHAESAASLYKHGESAEAREDYDAAVNDYQKAYALVPKDLRYKAAFYRIRVVASSLHVTKGRKLLQAGDTQGAMVELLRAAEIDPANEAAQQEMAHVREKQGEAPLTSDTSLPESAEKHEEIESIGAPAQLKPVSNEPLTLHMTEDSKVIYQAIGKAAGVNVLFDPDYTSKRIQVDLNSVTLLDALRIVGTISNTFWRAVTANTLFVAQNTHAKRTELDEQAVQTFYLTNAWQQNDLNDVSQAVRNVMTTAKVFAVPSQNAIVMRGTPDELLLAQKLIDDLDKARPEVVVDIAVLEVSKNWERNIGLSWPSSASVALQTSTTSSSTTCPTGSTTCTPSTSTSTPTIYNLAHLNANDLAVTIGSATANLLLTDSNTKILQNPRIRCTDSQKATMKIGERIPIATGSYGVGGVGTGGVGSALGGVGTVNTQFQYIDVGVNIEMTPTVHYDHDVTLKMKIEVSSENGTSTISGVTEPIIAQKTSEQVIRLREGEASVLSGILNKTDTVSWGGIPGLSAIPGIKYLFGSKDHTITDDEIVFLLIPHIVRSQDLGPANLRTVDTGVGTNIDLRHDASPTPSAAPSPASPPAAATRPAARSQFGTVPGTNVETAGPAALAQMRADADAPNRQPKAPAAPPLPQSQSQTPPQAQPSPGIRLAFIPQPNPVKVGSAFQLPITVEGGADIAAVPMQITYDPSKLSLVNVSGGDFLSRDGQAVAVVHRDEGPGLITLNVSRPPGAAGMSGAGVVCVIGFQAKAAGETSVVITRPTALSSAQQQLPASGGRIAIQVQ
jgi:general secretion pathway protein D